jgi:putative transposase
MAIYGELKRDIGFILRKLCDQKGIEIIEAQACPDHIHMLISIPPKMSVSSVVGYLKGKIIQQYIQNQLKEDELADQMSIKEYYDPFSGEKYPTRGGRK